MSKIIDTITLGFGKFSIGVVKLYMKLVFKPTPHYVDKSVQTNKLTEPRIIVANHTSLYDALFMIATLKGKVCVIIAKDWYEKKSINWILKAANAIPCDRYNMDTEWIMLAKKAIADGKSILIFPEGKIRTDGDLNEFKSGFAFLARYTGIPVVRIGLDGKYKKFHKSHYVVDIPEQIPRVKGNSSEYLNERSDYFRKKVIALKAQAINGRLEENNK